MQEFFKKLNCYDGLSFNVTQSVTSAFPRRAWERVCVKILHPALRTRHYPSAFSQQLFHFLPLRLQPLALRYRISIRVFQSFEMLRKAREVVCRITLDFLYAGQIVTYPAPFYNRR